MWSAYDMMDFGERESLVGGWCVQTVRMVVFSTIMIHG